MRKQKNDDEVIICLFPKMGDSVYGLAYAEQYKKETGKKICVLCVENLVSFINEYKFVDRVITYKKRSLTNAYVQMFSLVRMHNKKRIKRDGLIANVPPMLFYKGLTCLEVYRDYIYQVKEDIYNLYPRIIEPITCIPDFEKNKDKIVIINPYSFSQKINYGLYENIAKTLKKKGYIVYTNVIKSLGQKVIAGTLAFDSNNMFEVYSIMEKIPLVVSVRTGMLDMIASGNSNIFAVYYNKQIANRFSIKELRQKCENLENKNTCEVIYRKNKDKKLILEKFENFLAEIENKNKI